MQNHDDNLIIPILLEDDDLLIINKPWGITVNVSETTVGEVTIQDWAEKKLGLAKQAVPLEEGNDFYKRGGIVHRLDKETSGILILAKNPQAFITMQQQFKERTIKKAYHALAHGKVAPMEGEINVPVGRLPWNRTQFGIVAGGREAVTKYITLEHYEIRDRNQKEILSFLELYPETGRTHQIRVHLKYLNHPIFSDFLYAGRKTAKRDRALLSRVFLHAAKISFNHPRTQERIELVSPLAQELQTFLDTLQPVTD